MILMMIDWCDVLFVFGVCCDSGDNCDFDVLIVGVGLFGIGVVYYLKQCCLYVSVVIVEVCDVIGGIWDLFCYLGVCLDFDMFMFGYSFCLWYSDKVIFDGQMIFDYICDIVCIYGIDKMICYGQKVVVVDWDLNCVCWMVCIECMQDGVIDMFFYICCFLFMCSGYYDYDVGYLFDWVGMDMFEGKFVYLQYWLKDLLYVNWCVVVIGSGVMVVMFVLLMVVDVQYVMMLQCLLIYIVLLFVCDKIVNVLCCVLLLWFVYWFVCVKNVLLMMYLYNVLCCKFDWMK